MFPIWLLWGEGTVREQRWSVESSWPIGHDPGRVGSSLDRGVTGEVERCAHFANRDHRTRWWIMCPDGVGRLKTMRRKKKNHCLETGTEQGRGAGRFQWI